MGKTGETRIKVEAGESESTEDDKPMNFIEKLNIQRKNLVKILHFGTVLPFHWNNGYKCFYCSKFIKSSEELKEHTITKHAIIDLEAFISCNVYAKHIPVKLDVSTLACKVCNVNFEAIEELIKHIKENHDNSYDDNVDPCVLPFVLTDDVMQCQMCAGKFDGYMNLTTHMFRMHVPHKFVCQLCGMSFMDKIRLSRHLKCSHIGHKCSVCNKIFSAIHLLKKHKSIFHGISRAYNCELCSVELKSWYQLRVHMGKSHNVEKYQIRCNFCQKLCLTKGALNIHMQAVHSESKYVCDFCDYKSGIKWMVTSHMKKHLGEKNYECSICNKMFGRSSNLKAHMKVHTRVVGRVCRWCKKGFQDSISLQQHEAEIHDKERFG